MTIHLGRGLPRGSSNLPGGKTGRLIAALVGFAPGGACLARTVARPAGELLPHPFTLTPGREAEGGLLSVALARGHPRWALPSALPCGARTFLPAPKAPGGHPARPADRRRPPPETHQYGGSAPTRAEPWTHRMLAHPPRTRFAGRRPPQRLVGRDHHFVGAVGAHASVLRSIGGRPRLAVAAVGYGQSWVGVTFFESSKG